MLVSVIVPTYNQAEYINDALQSVLNQSFKNWECIIVDDGSTDNTAEIVKNWLSKDNRFKYLYIENNGVSHARNKGIEQAKGCFILPLDADDCLGINYMEKCLTKIRNPSVKIVYGKASFFGGKEGELLLRPPSLENLLKFNCIHCSGLFRKKDWEINKGYDENMTFGFEDWEFWINMLKKGGHACLAEECTLHYRIKSVSRSTKIVSDNDKNKQMRNYIFKKHIKLYGYDYAYEAYIDKLNLEKKLINIQSSLSLKGLINILVIKIKAYFFGNT
ncbi:glycosyltransferase family 2 protein [Changchengzhania lutea]|uniref:glycosyltransferase family 2 protein n=1 Tax=Changchengzhania lutea TaxID=2049305 RepID=UPI00115DB620|nr:glycosyltransferase family A protein [Changchengzhania lutea]